MIDGSYSPNRAPSSKLLHNTHGLYRNYLTLGTPIHHMQCEWHPEFCPAECATPFLPQGCNQSNILGLPCKSLADCLPYLSLSHFLPLSHTGLLSFPKIHQASAHLQASAPAVPHLQCSFLHPCMARAACALRSHLSDLLLGEIFREPSIYSSSTPLFTLCFHVVDGFF